MNILYFDEKELWSPSLVDMVEDVDEEQIISVSVHERVQGKKFTLNIAPAENPSEKFTITIGEE